MPKTLLVVDDSPTIRETARLALAGEDWVVVGAANPDEALELLWAQPPAAVLCDADPTGAGVELCRKLRALPEGADLPILLMGAAVTPAQASAAGATAALPKPFGAAELSDALQAALDAQGFSLELAGTDAPLTLEDLELPFEAPAAAPSAASPIRGVEEVEIIDLSGDEEYGELELIEDLEPLEVAAEATAPRPAPEGVALSFDADDLFASPAAPPSERAEEEPHEVIDLDALFATPTEAGEAADQFPEEPSVEEPPRLPEAPPVAPGLSLASWDAPLVPEELPAAPPASTVEEPFSYEPQWEEPGIAAAPAAAEPPDPSMQEAVRQALAAHLSPENLAPTVERIVERVVWEVVPRLAERLIREAIDKLQAEPPAG